MSEKLVSHPNIRMFHFLKFPIHNKYLNLKFYRLKDPLKGINATKFVQIDKLSSLIQFLNITSEVFL